MSALNHYKREARIASERLAEVKKMAVDRLGDGEGLVDCPNCDNAFTVPLDGREGWRCPCNPSTLLRPITKRRTA
jgi:hypothetical protein